jgi:hypothetical protein
MISQERVEHRKKWLESVGLEVSEYGYYLVPGFACIVGAMIREGEYGRGGWNWLPMWGLSKGFKEAWDWKPEEKKEDVMLSVKVGDTVKFRNGEKAEVVRVTEGDHEYFPISIKFSNGDCTDYTKRLAYLSSGMLHDYDIVEVFSESAENYVQQLAKKHPDRVAKLLKTDPAFKAAAEALAEKLAHALLSNPGKVVYRRPRQSAALFEAACMLMTDAGAGLCYTDGAVVVGRL